LFLKITCIRYIYNIIHTYIYMFSLSIFYLHIEKKGNELGKKLLNGLWSNFSFCKHINKQHIMTIRQKLYQLCIPILEASSALHDVISILTPVRIIPSFSLFLRVQVWIIFFYIFLFSLIVSSSEYHVQCNLYRILIVIMCCLLICLQKDTADIISVVFSNQTFVIS
jgi:hypothetical protein